MRDYVKDKRDMQVALMHHITGGKFEYTSYDHKAAVAEYKGTKDFQARCQYDMILGSTSKIGKYEISPEIRAKHAIRRIGKLRSVEFDPSGDIRRLKIGAHYAISFYNIDDLKFV